MSRLGKISFLFAGLSLLALGLTKFILGAWVAYMWVLLGLFALFILAGVFVDRKFFFEFFTMKTTKHGMNMGALILIFFALMAAINFIGVRKVKTWDFSSAQKNSLSEQSIQMIKNLDSELKVIFFYKKGQEGVDANKAAFRDLIRKYQDKTDKISLDFVEMNERPDLTKEFGVDKGSGIVFVSYKGKKNRIDKIDEQEMTGALVKVTRSQSKTVYFTQGHGEYNLDDSQEALGLFQLKTLLEGNNYQVKKWTINTEPKPPTDADIVMIVGPKHNFLDFEITSLETYLKNGGNLMVALKSQQPAGLEKFLKSLGVEAQNNYVYNIVETMMGRGINPGATFGSVFSTQHAATKVFSRGEVTLFQRPQGLKRIEPVPSGLNLEEIVSTAPNSMGFDNLNFKGEGQKGPFALVMSVKGTMGGADAKEFQALVSGDADFMNNQFLMQNLNRDLVLNSMAYFSKEENLISITPKEIGKTEIDPSTTKQATFYFGLVIPLPLLMLIASLVLWFRRRHA